MYAKELRILPQKPYVPSSWNVLFCIFQLFTPQKFWNWRGSVECDFCSRRRTYSARIGKPLILVLDGLAEIPEEQSDLKKLLI
jgi:hypothetical protein